MKIGFIDYYMSEWHANNYPAWIKEQAQELGISATVSYAFAELDSSPIDNVTTDEWCQKFGIVKCGSIKELCELSDFVIILAPSNPEKHLPYAKEAFKYAKRVYVDKTFAPNPEEARAIFELAKENGTEFFSSSALRYATELEDYIGSMEICTTGGGSSLAEYVIHQIEMVVKILGTGAKSVSCEQNGDVSVISVFYEDERHAVMNFSPKLGFSVSASDKKTQIKSAFFAALIADILNFAISGKKSFSGSETEEVIKIRSAAISAEANPCTVITL